MLFASEVFQDLGHVEIGDGTVRKDLTVKGHINVRNNESGEHGISVHNSAGSSKLRMSTEPGFSNIMGFHTGPDRKWSLYHRTGDENFNFRNHTISSNVLSLTNNGQVGVRCEAPHQNAIFQVNGDTFLSNDLTIGTGSGHVAFNSYWDRNDQRWEYRTKDRYAAGMKLHHNSGKLEFFNAPKNNGENGDPLPYAGTMTLTPEGNVGIGTFNPKNKLSVNGTIWAKEIKVSLTDGADYVFEEDYNLRSLDEVETFVKENKHLPGIPSAKEFAKDGMNVSEMSNKLLEKVEELTLYSISLEKKNAALLKRIEAIEVKLK